MRRISITGFQAPSTGLPVEAIVAELCNTKASTDKLVMLMTQVLDELKGLREDIKEGIEKSNLGIEKAEEVISKIEQASEVLTHVSNQRS